MPKKRNNQNPRGEYVGKYKSSPPRPGARFPKLMRVVHTVEYIYAKSRPATFTLNLFKFCQSEGLEKSKRTSKGIDLCNPETGRAVARVTDSTRQSDRAIKTLGIA